jgi:hypothetical protein
VLLFGTFRAWSTSVRRLTLTPRMLRSQRGESLTTLRVRNSEHGCTGRELSYSITTSRCPTLIVELTFA